VAHAAAATDGKAGAAVTPLPATRLARRLGRGRATVVGLAVLVLGGFALRWSTARVETLMGSDACQYLLLAEGVASGRGFVSGGSEHPDVTRLPAFPLLLAPLGAATGDYEGAARFLVTLAGALLPLPLWWLARRSFGPDAAWLASLMGAFSCVHGAAGFLLPDPIALLLLLASAAAGGGARPPPPGGGGRAPPPLRLVQIKSRAGRAASRCSTVPA
jgi:hypothetical protein